MRRATVFAATVLWVIALGCVASGRWAPVVVGDDPFGLLFSGALIGVRVLAGYFLLALVLEVLARVLDAAPLRRLSAAVTPWIVRRSLALVVAAGAVTAATTPAGASEGTVVTVHLVTGDDERGVPAETLALPRPASHRQPAPPPRTWTVRPGDSFWSIAAAISPPHDEISATWRRLIDMNRGRLVDRGNPDLLLPGQQLRVPCPRGE